jgi:NAD(P)-dependent dehydrogenase (short-subunit alcohol dehydrogenase family)
MKITGNTILITGGATGIGLALAEVFLREGNQVIICGRTEKKLQEAKSKLPLLLIRVCDVSKDSERKNLFQWATKASDKKSDRLLPPIVPDGGRHSPEVVAFNFLHLDDRIYGCTWAP